MNCYRNQNPMLTAPTAIPNPSDELAPGARVKPCPMRFKVKCSVYEKEPSQSFTVEAEYWKYVSGDNSSKETDILRFWEVRLLYFQ
jgi:hypothetical protein